MDGIEIEVTKTCPQCGALVALHCKFCSNCGISQSNEIVSQPEKKLTILKQAAIFYFIDVSICLLSKFVAVFNTFFGSLFFDAALAITAVAFFSSSWTENKNLLNWKSFSWKKLVGYCMIAMLGSLVVHYSVGWLNVTIYSSNENYYSVLSGNLFAEFLLFFLVAIMPAVFEELAYRGYLLQTLLGVVDRGQAIYISAFLFAILHLNFVSLFWLIPFALFLGYIRIKENSIWYGVFFHFTFNLMACILEIHYAAIH